VRVGRGGRYDRLTASVGPAEPAIGFVLDLDALTEVLSRRTSDIGFEDASGMTEIRGHNEIETFAEATRRRASNERVRVAL
jgi:ATP phosphoribosyltransferase regulatory subunit HisZ